MRNLRLISSQLSRIHKTPNPEIPKFGRHFCTQTAVKPSDEVNAIVDEISGLTLLEVMDLTEVLRKKLNVSEMPVMAVMMPGMGFGPMPGGGRGGGAAVAEKAEKTMFDVKLDGFDSAAKIKVIKEVRGFTDLGLKEAKDLVEKAPTVLKKGVTKEEAEIIMKKLTDVGAKSFDGMRSRRE
ncbi:uncharacterized protein [Rutidosis leptorrhynchoides]|uniref:uncharacterized protein n=1 Tax=Rutidosis leptorrhynchoides TaxID=125765 RepID=UPI003A9966EB